VKPVEKIIAKIIKESGMRVIFSALILFFSTYSFIWSLLVSASEAFPKGFYVPLRIFLVAATGYFLVFSLIHFFKTILK
jgi:hypothetical protein